MGSFNTTCFVSQQTISSYNPVYLFPIEQGSSYDPFELQHGNTRTSQYSYSCSTCYPTGLWTLSGPMLQAKYDDYGRFEILDTPHNHHNMISLFKHLVEDSATINAGDSSFNMANHFNQENQYSFEELLEIWQYMWDAVQENRIFVENFSQALVPFAFAVMHKVTGDYLVETVSSSENYRGDNLDQTIYFQNYVNGKLTQKKKYSPTPKEFLHSLAFAIGSLENFGIGEFEGCYSTNYYTDNIDNIIGILEEYFKVNPEATEVDLPTIKDIMTAMQDYINLRYILKELLDLNTKITPMVYAGQDYNNDIGNQFTTMINEVNKRVNHLED